jgi:hypothetical protein
MWLLLVVMCDGDMSSVIRETLCVLLPCIPMHFNVMFILFLLQYILNLCYFSYISYGDL